MPPATHRHVGRPPAAPTRVVSAHYPPRALAAVDRLAAARSTDRTEVTAALAAALASGAWRPRPSPTMPDEGATIRVGARVPAVAAAGLATVSASMRLSVSAALAWAAEDAADGRLALPLTDGRRKKDRT